MWNDRTLEADIEYAAEMVREGLATAEQAAQACGIPLPRLQAHLTGIAQPATEPVSTCPGELRGSVSTSPNPREDAAEFRRARAQPGTVDESQPSAETAETTDYFVFYREEGRWVWKRIDKDGKIVKSCQDRFQYYLDCVADARPHGFNGRPLFIFAASDIASLNAPDKPR